MKFFSFLKRSAVADWLMWMLLFCIPFGTRIFLGSAISGFHEYEAFFFYATDLVVLTGIVVCLGKMKASAFADWKRARLLIVALALFLLSVFVSTGGATLPSLAWYAALRLFLLALLFYTAATRIRHQVWSVGLGVVATSSFLQALVVLCQSFRQSSLGLQVLGESVLSVGSPSASTIVFEGARVLRAYGTFPHPNVAGLFLVFGLLISLYWYLRQSAASDLLFRGMGRREFLLSSRAERANLFRRFFFSRAFAFKIGSVALFFVHACALIFTFSRSAWLAAVAGIIVLLLFYLRPSPRAVLRASLVVVATAGVLSFTFAPYIVPRASVQRTEPAVTERLRFYEVAQRSLSLYPQGVGIGNQIVSSVREGFYREEGMKRVWQWEPVHNLFVLVATEVGFVGGVLFLTFFLLLFFSASRSSSSLRGIACALLITVLVAGLFDHYLWTLQPGRLMLWTVTGLCMAVALSREEK